MELTKYELSRLIGARAFQLASMAPPLLKVESGMDFIQVAEQEFGKGIIPLAVLRKKER